MTTVINTTLTPAQFKKALAADIQKAKVCYATSKVKEILGEGFCVCWLTHDKPAKLMISGIDRHSYGVGDEVIHRVTNILFPNIEFEVTEKDFGRTIAFVFEPK